MKEKSKISDYKLQVIKNIIQKFPWEKTCEAIKKLKLISPTDELNMCDDDIECLRRFCTQMLIDLCLQYQEGQDEFVQVGSVYSNCMLAQIDERCNVSLIFAPFLIYETDIIADIKKLN